MLKLLLNIFIKQETRTILYLLEYDYCDWTLTEHRMIYKTGFSLWVNNRLLYTEDYKLGVSFNIIEKLLIKRAIHRAYILKGLKNEN